MGGKIVKSEICPYDIPEISYVLRSDCTESIPNNSTAVKKKGDRMNSGKYSKYITKAPFDKGPFGHPRLKYQRDEKGGDFNLGVSVNYITGPDRVPDKPHTHPFNELWFFLGADPSNPKDFDAEAEVYLGEEGEKYVIKEATALEIPSGLVHCPLIFTKVNKPVIFMNMALTSKYVQNETKNSIKL